MSHSPVFSQQAHTDVIYALPLGIFPLIPEPEFELFAAHRRTWLPKVEGAKQYKFMPNSGEIDA